MLSLQKLNDLVEWTNQAKELSKDNKDLAARVKTLEEAISIKDIKKPVQANEYGSYFHPIIEALKKIANAWPAELPYPQKNNKEVTPGTLVSQLSKPCTLKAITADINQQIAQNNNQAAPVRADSNNNEEIIIATEKKNEETQNEQPLSLDDLAKKQGSFLQKLTLKQKNLPENSKEYIKINELFRVIVQLSLMNDQYQVNQETVTTLNNLEAKYKLIEKDVDDHIKFMEYTQNIDAPLAELEKILPDNKKIKTLRDEIVQFNKTPLDMISDKGSFSKRSDVKTFNTSLQSQLQRLDNELSTQPIYAKIGYLVLHAIAACTIVGLPVVGYSLGKWAATGASIFHRDLTKKQDLLHKADKAMRKDPLVVPAEPTRPPVLPFPNGNGGKI